MKPVTKTAPVAASDTLATYQSSKYGKELFVSKAKVGKTVALVGNALGVFPWQEHGGIVDDPANLHIITLDAAALDGCFEFLTDICGAPKECGQAKVYNLQRHAEAAFTKGGSYDPTFPSAVYDELRKIRERVAKGGIHAVIVSSLTMLAKAWLRSISGPAFSPGNKSAMDQNKWNSLKQQLGEFQWQAQSDQYHCLWEAHHGEKVEKDTGTGMPSITDTLQVDGGTAKTFPANVERIWEIKRTANYAKDSGGKVYNKHLHDVWFDPFPRFDFGDIQTGRKVSGRLEPREPDLTRAFHALGLKVGHWGV